MNKSFGSSGIFLATKICMSKYFDSKGRASRPEFWYFLLFNVIVSIIITSFGSAVVNADLNGSIANLVFFAPTLMVTMRRLHDLNKPGTLAFLLLVPLVGFFIVLYMCAQEGTAGDNDFGPPPDSIYGGSAANDGAAFHQYDEPQYDQNAEPEERPSMDFNYEDIDYGSDAEPAAEPEDVMQKYGRDKPETSSSDGQKRDRYGRLIKGGDAKSKNKSDFLEG